MRWQDLFADLESQADAWERAERDAEVADRSRAEQAAVSLMSRLAAAVGQPVTVRVCGVGDVHGVLTTLGAEWLLLSDPSPAGADQLVSLSALTAVVDLDRRAEAPQARSAVLARLGLVAPLRALVRDRATVRVLLRDATTLTGTLERVGEDHVDLLMHEVGENARTGRGRVSVPFAALGVVRTVASGWG